MVERLILGSGSLVPRVVSRFDDPVRIGTADDQLASTLRGSDTEVELLDPTDEQTLSTLNADVVFVVEDTEMAAVAIVRAVRDALPEVYLVAYGGTDTGGNTVLSSLVDRTLDPGRAVASHVLECVGQPQLPRLWQVLREIDRLAVMAHDNPDPDAIASGVALARLAREADCDAEVCYYGEISHQENRAFVNVLNLDMRNLQPGADLSEFDGVALVDHAQPGVNDQLPADTPVDIVIDHHPPRGPVEARFVDLHSEVGATCTMLLEYFDRYGQELESDVATALLFGIHVDTDGFRRGVAARDFEAAATLVEAAELETLERIESPGIDRGTFDVLSRAIDNRRVEGEVVLSFVGSLDNRDVLPQAADRLLHLEGVSTTVVYGIIDGTAYVSARSRTDGLDLGEVVREAFSPMGSAGGHADMAGAQLELGEPDDEASVAPLVDSLVADRFLDVLGDRLQQPPLRSTSEEGDPLPGHSERDEHVDAGSDG